MKLTYTPAALPELATILDFIDANSAGGSRRVKQRLREIERLLRRYPNAGHRTSHPRLRQIATTPYPYVFYYLVEESAVIVIAVRHGARNTNPADLAPD